MIVSQCLKKSCHSLTGLISCHDLSCLGTHTLNQTSKNGVRHALSASSWGIAGALSNQTASGRVTMHVIYTLSNWTFNSSQPCKFVHPLPSVYLFKICINQFKSASLNVKTKQLTNDILPQMPACFLVATRLIMRGSNEILNSVVNSQCFASNQSDAWVGTAETEMLKAVFPFSSFTHTFTYSLYIKPVFMHIDFICFQAWFIYKKMTRCSHGRVNY